MADTFAWETAWLISFPAANSNIPTIPAIATFGGGGGKQRAKQVSGRMLSSGFGCLLANFFLDPQTQIFFFHTSWESLFVPNFSNDVKHEEEFRPHSSFQSILYGCCCGVVISNGVSEVQGTKIDVWRSSRRVVARAVFLGVGPITFFPPCQQKARE
jgi:hypothetical protein